MLSLYSMKFSYNDNICLFIRESGAYNRVNLLVLHYWQIAVSTVEVRYVALWFSHYCHEISFTTIAAIKFVETCRTSGSRKDLQSQKTASKSDHPFSTK